MKKVKLDRSVAIISRLHDAHRSVYYSLTVLNTNDDPAMSRYFVNHGLSACDELLNVFGDLEEHIVGPV